MKNKLVELDLNLTNRCNFRCHHCGYDSGEKIVSELKIKVIFQQLREFKQLGGKYLDITGGEPLLRSDLKPIIILARKLELEVRLLTNGSLLNRDSLVDFKKLGVSGLGISLDASSYEVYHLIRPVTREVYERVLDNIKTAVDLGFKVRINTVVLQSNLADLASIAQLSIRLGVKDQRFCFFSPIGRGANCPEEIVSPTEFLAIIKRELLPLSSRINISFGIPQLPIELARKFSFSCRLNNGCHLELRPDGSIYPCPLVNDRFSHIDKSLMGIINYWQNQNNHCPLADEPLADGYQFICPFIKINVQDLFVL